MAYQQNTTSQARSRPLPRPLRIAVLCAEEPEDLLAMQIVYCLADLGARIFIISDGKERIYKYSRYVTKYTIAPYPNNISDLSSFKEWLGDYIDRYKIDIIVGSDIFTVKLTTYISYDFKQTRFFPIADLKLIEQLDDKWSFFQLLQQAQLPSPDTIRLDEWTEATRQQVANLGFPVMTKPLALSGGRGIIRFDALKEIDAYLRSSQPFNQLPLLVQRYCPGKDIGLAVFADQGRLIAHSVQIKEKVRGFGESIQFVDHDEVISLGARVIAETRYTGPGFIDMRLDEDENRVYALEFNPRLWFTVAVAMWHGCNYVEAGLRSAFGADPMVQTNPKPGTFYSLAALRSRRLLRPRRLNALTRANLKGIWMEKSDLFVILYRRIRAFRHKRHLRTQRTEGHLFWQATKTGRKKSNLAAATKSD